MPGRAPVHPRLQHLLTGHDFVGDPHGRGALRERRPGPPARVHHPGPQASRPPTPPSPVMTSPPRFPAEYCFCGATACPMPSSSGRSLRPCHFTQMLGGVFFFCPSAQPPSEGPGSAPEAVAFLRRCWSADPAGRPTGPAFVAFVETLWGEGSDGTVGLRKPNEDEAQLLPDNHHEAMRSRLLLDIG